MIDIITKEGGIPLLLLGNEAIVRGAFEAGVAYVSTYPGTPSSEIGDNFFRIASKSDIYFEYSTNEKVALEFAMGAAFAGARALCAMKHVGMNVAADALGSMSYIGVVGGLVIITADDPGCHSSQNEQDNRYYGKLTNLPVFEPSSPEEALLMTREAFKLSEKLELPIILRTTTRISHMRAPIITTSPISPVKARGIKIDPKRFVCIPAHARPNHLRLLKQMHVAKQKAEKSEFNFKEGNSSSEFGIITSSVSYNYVHDIINEENLSDNVEILKIGFSNPFPKELAVNFLENKSKVLIVEELEPILEKEVQVCLFENQMHVQILGKKDDVLPLFGELNPDLVLKAIERLMNFKAAVYIPPEEISIPPARPPTLCAGCPHRATYYAVQSATAGKAIYETDIGCYTLGVLPPLETAHHTVDMGASINTAAAMSHETELPVFAFIGDSTFFHSGITGLINAVHNNHKFILTILDNRTTAMTGHQPHPGASKHLGLIDSPEISLEEIVKACGVKKLKVVNPHEMKETIEAYLWAMEQTEIAVIISRAPCALLKVVKLSTSTPRIVAYQVNQELCRICGIHPSENACTIEQDRWQILERSKQAILRHGPYLKEHHYLPPQLSHAPCASTCPAGLCVQGYMTHTKSGDFKKALMLVREHIPFPSICGFVCDRPCENNCVRNQIDDPLSIRHIKRFIADYDEPIDENHFMVKKAKSVPKNGKKIAIIGAGPAGLTAAHDLLLRGYSPTVFDREQKGGGIMYSLIPEYRLPHSIIDKEVKVIELMGADFKFGIEIGLDISFEKLIVDYEALLFALGAGASTPLDIENNTDDVLLDGFSFLKSQTIREELQLTDKKVVVIGGGNAAIDCARVANFKGADVTIVYRRFREQMPADDDEINRALDQGVKIEFLLSPISLKEEAGQVKLQLQEMELGPEDISGRPRPIPIEGKTRTIEVDYVIPAIGQKGEMLTGELAAKIKSSSKLIPVDSKTMKTPLEKVFAAGDAVSGPSSIIGAVAQGKRAAYGIDLMLNDNHDMVAPLELPEWEQDPWRVPEGDTIRQQFKIEATGELRGEAQDFTEKEAQQEAQRCLSCGTCAHCLNCVINFSCPAIFYKDDKVEIDPILCVACGDCAQVCPNGAIQPVFAEELK